jgi:SAM-dependent methyltransferase
LWVSDASGISAVGETGPVDERDLSAAFPPGFFDRADPTPDADFYLPPRFVTHIDDTAIAAVGDLYTELGVDGQVLDLMGSWVSHFHDAPTHLTVLGMNAAELAANPQAAATTVHDLNAEPRLPFGTASFDGAVCCVSVDYLIRPVEVFADVGRTLRPGAPFVVTFSNRCFPTKAIRGWLATTDAQHCEIVARYFRLAGGFDEPMIDRRTPVAHTSDPLFTVWARRSSAA